MPPISLNFDRKKTLALTPVTSASGIGAVASTKQLAAATLSTKHLTISTSASSSVSAGNASASTGADAAFEGCVEWDQQPGGKVTFTISFVYDVSGSVTLTGGPGAAMTLPFLPLISGTASSYGFLGIFAEIIDRNTGKTVAHLKDDYFSNYAALGSTTSPIAIKNKVTSFKFRLTRGTEYYWRFTNYGRISTGVTGVKTSSKSIAKTILTLKSVSVSPPTMFPIPCV